MLMTNMREAWKHERKEIDPFQQYDDDVIQNTHYVLVCVEEW